jgi:hypothetical protein
MQYIVGTFQPWNVSCVTYKDKSWLTPDETTVRKTNKQQAERMRWPTFTKTIKNWIANSAQTKASIRLGAG